MISIRTDLAVEAKEIYENENLHSKIPGVEIKEYVEDDIKITEVKIKNIEGERAMNKPIGTYITIDMPEFTHYDTDLMEKVSRAIGKNISMLIKLEDSMTALVVGLGNWNVTPDAVGPKVVSKLMVTRHLKQLVPDTIDEGIRPVCAISPGVLGLTGIETGEIIRGVSDKIKPDLIICVDALASRSMNRVNSTIQIGNTGISPGSGVGNKRMEISEKVLGVPVLAVGIPTVVDAATMANDTIDLVIDEMTKKSKQSGEFYNMLKNIDKSEKYKLIQEVLHPYVGNLIVTPKDIDDVIETISKIIATGINLALQPNLAIDEINQYIN